MGDIDYEAFRFTTILVGLVVLVFSILGLANAGNSYRNRDKKMWPEQAAKQKLRKDKGIFLGFFAFGAFLCIGNYVFGEYFIEVTMLTMEITAVLTVVTIIIRSRVEIINQINNFFWGHNHSIDRKIVMNQIPLNN